MFLRQWRSSNFYATLRLQLPIISDLAAAASEFTEEEWLL
jgi:hypothetical protein